jgi:hypothetical protein
MRSRSPSFIRMRLTWVLTVASLIEAGRHLPVGEAGADQGEHLPFPLGQYLEWSRRRLRRVWLAGELLDEASRYRGGQQAVA